MTTAKKTRKPKFTAEQAAAYRAEKRDETTAMMSSAVEELLTSEGWQRWVAFRSRVHSYSLHNTWLIAMQMPTASIVQSYKKWQAAGRNVIAGERSLKVLAPMLRYPTSDEIAAGAQPDVKRVYGYRLVSTFDVSQTEGDPLPIVEPAPLTGDSHVAYLTKLEHFATQMGVTVRYEEMTLGGGYYDPANKLIVIKQGDSNQMVSVLIHEIAHALGVGYKSHGRHDAEVIVETVAHIVCSGIGLDTSCSAVPYIAGWGEQDKGAAIQKFAGLVDSLARQIEKAVA